MIKIRVSPEKMKEIEEKHWKWFEKEFSDIKFKEKIEKIKAELKEKDDLEKLKKKRNKLEQFLKYFNKNSERIVKSKELEKVIIEIENKFFNFFKSIIYLRIYRKFDIYFRKKLNLIKSIDEDLKNDELEKVKDEMKKYYKIQKKIYKKIIDIDDKLIDMINVTDEKINKYNKNICEKIKAEINEEHKDLIEGLKKIVFDYNKLVTGNKEWSRHKLLTELGIQVCPYCNRQYISSFEEIEDEEKTTADLDHFYIKDNYPYLALSLYNFIPSCQICNSRLKGTKDFVVQPVLYPYNENEDFGEKAKFTIEFNNKDELKANKKYNPDVLAGNSDDFFINIKFDENGELAEKIKNSIDIFKLKKVYQSHKDYIRELIRKAIVYNESRIDELFNEYEGTLFNSREDVVSMIVSNYIDDEDLDKRVLAKLTKDISEELGLK